MPLPKLAVTAGLMVANMALTMTKKIEGPRLDDLSFTQGDYGTPLAMMWGKRRLTANVFWAEDLKEVKRESKTKGGKYNDYRYYGTWAVALAGHEISNVTRLWFDTHLIYDVTGAGPILPFAFGGGLAAGVERKQVNQGRKETSLFSIYTGTADQEPDERMEATVEAEFGEGSCPAYRDTAYIIFKDMPLEKFGNRIPQVHVEMVSASSDIYPSEIKSISDELYVRRAAFNSDFSRIIAYGDRAEIWDTSSRSNLINMSWPPGFAPYGDLKPGFWADGRVWFCDASQTRLLSFSSDFLTVEEVFTFPQNNMQNGVRVIMDGDGEEHWGTIASLIGPDVFFDSGAISLDEVAGREFLAYSYFADSHGDVWVAGRSGTTNAIFYRLVNVSNRGGPDLVVSEDLVPSSSVVEATHYADDDKDHFVVTWGSKTYAIGINDGLIKASSSGKPLQQAFLNIRPGAETVWANNEEISLSDLTTVRTVNFANWGSFTGLEGIYDPINHAIVSTGGPGQSLTWLYLDRVGDGTVTLGTIMADTAERCGVSDYSFAALDQPIPGWSAVRGPASNMTEPLLDVYDSDIAPHDFTIRGTKRDGISGGTLLTERFVGNPRYSLALRQASELPRSITVDFADINADQQPNNVRSDRRIEETGARSEESLDMTTLVLDPSIARGLCDRHFRRRWNSRREVSNGLTMQQTGLAPADVRTLDLDGERWDARLVSMTFRADDSIACEWIYDHPSLANVTNDAGANFDGRDESKIVVPLPTKGFVLDIPLIRDADDSDNPVIYMAAAPYAEGAWPGATIYRALDGEYSDEINSFASSGGATWGYANGVLASADPWLWDRGNSLSVTVQSGDLTGATEAALNANPLLNLCLLGDELLQFSNAVLQPDGTYIISGFKRGRRGTEWAVDGHAARDVFLLLDTAQDDALDLSDVGTSQSFKAITAGRTDGFATTLTVEGNSLKPYAPAHLEAEKQDNGDWLLSWTRRTRIGGAWTGGIIPLGEDAEAYNLTIAGVQKTAVTSQYLWTVAEQTADTGAEVLTEPDWSVAQVSAQVGAGFLATA